MNPFAVLAACQAFLESIAPEVRERCHETTFQKLQLILNEVTAAATPPEVSFAGGVDLGGPAMPDPTDVINRFMAMLETSEAIQREREKVTVGLVASMEKIATLLFDTTTPAAG